MSEYDEQPDSEAQEGEPLSAKQYLDAITESQKAFETWHDKCDKIDKIYADLEHQANSNRDRQMAVFWANIQVLGPSVYSRPPVPVVVERFKDRDPVKSQASEILERATNIVFDLEDIDAVMREIRDDLNLNARGVPRLRVEERDEQNFVCIEHVDRHDFCHGLARKWKEVPWVAYRAWLDKEQMAERFGPEHAMNANYAVDKDAKDRGAATKEQKCAVWEVWDKDAKKVCWVSEGIDDVLDSDEPLLTLEGFFPTPKPAYATVQRNSLVPVPDYVYYQDQLEEINELTNRIQALTSAVKVKGFYAAGGDDVGDAVEKAMKLNDDQAIMVPVSNFAAFGSGGDVIIWLPIDQIVQTIQSLVLMRQQLIADVYEITGLSDIMRGATDPNETLGAQQLKSQYGSVRIRDKQHALVRVARDIARMAAEILAENFDIDALLEMAQIELPSDADIQKQIDEVVQKADAQAREAMANPQLMEQAQQDPNAAKQALQQLQAATQKQVNELAAQPTKEKVASLLSEQRMRPFALDIETDSTIQPDEDAEKQRRAEFLTALGGAMQQLAPMVQGQPQTAGFAGEVLKFAVAPFRAGRELDAAIDEFVDNMQQQASQPQQNPEAEKAKAEAETKAKEMELKQAELQMKMQTDQAKIQADMQKMQMEGQKGVADAQAKQAEAQLKINQLEAKILADSQKHAQDMEKGQLDIQKLTLDIEKIQTTIDATQTKAAIDVQRAQTDEARADRQEQRNAQQIEQGAEK